MLEFNKNIIVSRTYKDFTLIFDGKETYYLYFEDKEIDKITNRKCTPTDVYNDNFGDNYTNKLIFDDVDEIKKKLDITQCIINSINIKLKDATNDDKHYIFQELIRSLKNAYSENKELSGFIENASKTIRDKLLELKSLHDNNEDDLICLPENETEKQNIQSDAYNEFLKLLNIYDNDPIRLYDNKLNFYLANSENLFKMVIHGLGANLKKVSRIIILNGGSKSGKSKLKSQISKMMPIFEDIGRSSMAYVIGIEDPYYYDGSIIYGGDKGLTVEDHKNFEAIVGFYSELVTDNYVFRGTMPNNNRRECKFYTNGILYFITEPYTNLSTFKASDQVKSRTTNITVNPLTKQQSEKLIDNKYDDNIPDDKEFEQLHKNYISHIINNPLTIKLNKELEKTLLRKCNHDNRKHEYLLGLFISYCQYLNIEKPTITNLNQFIDIFYDKYEITDIEHMVYEFLYRNLKPLTDKEIETKIKEGWNTKTDMLNQRANRKSKCFFTVKQVKTYFRNEFRRNQHLKDVIDSLGDILNNLYNAELLERLETASKQENIYYIPYNEELENE